MEPEGRHDGAQDVVWCQRCGIPHAAGMTRCSYCGQPLGEGADTQTADRARPATASSEPTAGSSPAAWSAPASAAAPARKPGLAARAPRLPRRTQPTSDAEIEAAAAAIVARARAMEETLSRSAPADTPSSPDAHGPSAAAATDSTSVWSGVPRRPLPTAAPPTGKHDPTARAPRLPRRNESTSEAEIEAAAAAIVAQARAMEEALGRAAPTDAPEPSDAARTSMAPVPASIGDWPGVPRVPSSSPPPSLFAAMPQRDRIWLIAGIVLCVVLVLFAIVFARNLAGVG